MYDIYIVYYKVSIGPLEENEKNNPRNLKNENLGVKGNDKYNQTDVKSCHLGVLPSGHHNADHDLISFPSLSPPYSLTTLPVVPVLFLIFKGLGRNKGDIKPNSSLSESLTYSHQNLPFVT